MKQRLGRVPEHNHRLPSLQNGAKLFVNYCLNCHSAAYMRYNRMHDIGLTDDQIKKNLLFATDKVGDTMKVTLDPKQAKDWFGAPPPDLSVIARSRAEVGKGSGADYLYTYLRTFYRDDTKATGWNNLAFPDVAMPHALWELQGERRAQVRRRRRDPHEAGRKTVHRFRELRAALARARRRRWNTTRRSPTWSPTCSGWASRPRTRAYASASGC